MGSPTEYNTKGSVEDSLKDTGLRIHHQSTISYDFKFGSLEENCKATYILVGPLFPKIAETTGAKQEDIEKMYCEKVADKMKAQTSHWKSVNSHMEHGDSWKLGQGTAAIYRLMKGLEYDEL